MVGPIELGYRTAPTSLAEPFPKSGVFREMDNGLCE
jgi:hypothetical protein